VSILLGRAQIFMVVVQKMIYQEWRFRQITPADFGGSQMNFGWAAMVHATFRMIATISLLWGYTALAAGPPPEAVTSTMVEQGIHRHQLRLALNEGGADLFFDPNNQRLVFAPADARDRAAALSTLLDAFFASHDPKPRYQFSGASADGLAGRLATELLRDPGWNATIGRAVSGPDRDTLLRVLNKAVPFADIAGVWRTHGYSLRAVTVEDILIGRRGELSSNPGERENARVPVSFVIEYEAVKEDIR
jgi:hypothetical protein